MNIRVLAATRRRGMSQALPTMLTALLVILLGCSVLTGLVATNP